jgi:quercetin dioxygenase-like cupin family protein
MSTFETLANLRPYPLREDITARAVSGERMTLAVMDLQPNAISPEHQHENEQIGFVIAGTITMQIGGEKSVRQAGDMWMIPSNVPHDAVAGPDGCSVAEVFAPVRADWEKLNRLKPAPGRWP